MGVTMDQVLDDLEAETRVLYELVADLGDPGIAAATPAAGWSIRDQLTHLAYFDETATLAAVNPPAFRRAAEALMAGGEDFPTGSPPSTPNCPRPTSGTGSSARAGSSSLSSAGSIRRRAFLGTGRT